MEKRGISPVIATLLLVGMVVVSALIVFVWIRGFTEETVTKFGGENIELACEKVNFEASYSNGELSVVNIGNVPIYDLNIKVSSVGSYNTEKASDISGNWPEIGLNQGQSFSGSISMNINSGDEITLTPILRGQTSGGGEKTYSCEEQYGTKIII